MKILLLALLILTLSTPIFARPYQYNFSLGPDYWATSSNSGTINSALVTSGFAFRGNLFNLNAEYQGGFGEISSTKITYNDFSLLYNAINDPNHFLGLGVKYSSVRNTLSKSNSTSMHSANLNAKLHWEYSRSPLFGFFVRAFGPNIWGYDIGWLFYFDKDLGDFNLRFGYRSYNLENLGSMNGLYIASAVYF
jgi:hypothetical protein